MAAAPHPSSLKYPTSSDAGWLSNNVDEFTRVNRERFLYVLMSMMGSTVNLTVKNGTVYSGVLTAVDLSEKEFQVVLQWARMKPKRSNPTTDKVTKPIEAIRFPTKDIVAVTVASLTLGGASAAAAKNSGSFATDAAISAPQGKGGPRELVAWQPEPGNAAGGGLEDGADFHAGGGGGGGGRRGKHGAGVTGWDQFAANERKFGVKSTYDEDLYTTPLNRHDPGFKSREKEAARLAREIERGVSANPHVAEERGQVPTGGDTMDEEALYGAVVRTAADSTAPPDSPSGRSASKYVPPHLRGKDDAGAAAPAAKKEESSAGKSGGDEGDAKAKSEKKDTKEDTKKKGGKGFSFNVDAEAFIPSSATPAAFTGVPVMPQYGYMPGAVPGMPPGAGGVAAGAGRGGNMRPGAPYSGQMMAMQMPQAQQQQQLAAAAAMYGAAGPPNGGAGFARGAGAGAAAGGFAPMYGGMPYPPAFAPNGQMGYPPQAMAGAGAGRGGAGAGRGGAAPPAGMPPGGGAGRGGAPYGGAPWMMGGPGGPMPPMDPAMANYYSVTGAPQYVAAGQGGAAPPAGNNGGAAAPEGQQQ